MCLTKSVKGISWAIAGYLTILDLIVLAKIQMCKMKGQPINTLLRFFSSSGLHRERHYSMLVKQVLIGSI